MASAANNNNVALYAVWYGIVDQTDMDIDIFARSSHLGEPSSDPTTIRKARRSLDGRSLRKQSAGTPWQDPSGQWGNDDDDGSGLEGDTHTMMLGRIFHFDQALYFEGSPLKRHYHYSLGEFRLDKPGNKTETGGSERWKKVLEYPFELIIRGVLRYEIPITNRAQSARIFGSVLVHPEEGVDRFGDLRLEDVDESERWQWVEHSDLEEYHDISRT